MGSTLTNRDAIFRWSGIKAEIQTLIGAVPLLFFVTSTTAFGVNERASNIVGSKASENRDATTWEEPTLFPPEVTESPSNTMSSREKPRSDDRQVETLPASAIESSATSNQTSVPLRTDFGRPGITASNALGLESTVEREATRARLQADSATLPYNIKIGKIPFYLSSGFDAEFSDNILRNNRNRKSDLQMLARLDLSGSVKLASTTTLSLGLGVGYIKYLSHSEDDRFLTTASLTPNTGLSLDMKIGNFIVSIYDRPSLPQFQADSITQRTQTQYNQFRNTAGLSVLWNINSRTTFSTHYDHTTSVSLSSGKSTSDGSSDSFLASLSCQLTDSLGVGLEAGAQMERYSSNFLNDGTTYHFGPTAHFNLSRYVRLQGSFGYQGGSYDNGGAIKDNSSLGTFYANFSVANNLNSHFNHSLSFGEQSQAGAFSNFTETKYVTYQAQWDLINGVNLGANISFQDVQESGGLFAEHFRNLSAGIYCSLNLTKRISLSLAYTYTKRHAIGDSASLLGDLDFNENRVSLHMGYAF